VAADVRVGTSGWSYPTGRGAWTGVFYPARRARGFDELEYYAEHFDTVEVNSTFYRVAGPAAARRWVDRTPAGFLFSVKLYQKFTHPDMYIARHGVADWDLARADVDAVRASLEPLAAAGRLAAVLVQFPPSFHAGPDTRAYLEWILDAFPEYPLAVELRHRTWGDTAADTRASLEARGAAWVFIDEPKFGESIRQEAPGPEGSRTPAYFRLHGRNARAWWSPPEPEDRYDYLYSRLELAPFAHAAKNASAAGRRVLMYLNNHFSAKAVANAAVLKNELGQPLPGTYEPEMTARYPELTGLVTTSRSLL
jgi:uncharacterized protein YecE (DUF72 family)